MIYDTLQSLCDSMECIYGVKSCKIGIEANISPADYPLIRIVPLRIFGGKPYNNRTSETGVYFGVNITESQGLDNVYKQLLELEGEIIKSIKANGGRYVETITDEDRLDTYKLMFIRFEIEAERPLVS